MTSKKSPEPLSLFFTPKNTPVVYAITGRGSKSYIGCSKNYQQRMTRHGFELESGYHGCAALQKDYNKYGIEYFTVIVLRKFRNMTNAYAYEALLIRKMDTSIYNPKPKTRGKVRKYLGSIDNG